MSVSAFCNLLSCFINLNNKDDIEFFQKLFLEKLAGILKKAEKMSKQKNLDTLNFHENDVYLRNLFYSIFIL